MVGSRNNRASRIIKLLISTGFYAYTLVRRLFLLMLGRAPDASCIILYYHSIPLDYRHEFAKQMDMVAQLTEPINLDAVPRLRSGKRYSAITFDDGFEDALENAVPELVKRNIPATFFVTVDVLGGLAAWWPEAAPERNRRIATARQLKRLPVGLISIGTHTLTHPRLSLLNEADARREIGEPRRRLEALLGRTIKSFSFPYGEFTEDVVRWSGECGYERVFTTQHKKAFAKAGQFVVGRVKAEPIDWHWEFRLKLLGGYLWLPFASATKHAVLSNPIVNGSRFLIRLFRGIRLRKKHNHNAISAKFRLETTAKINSKAPS
jgi:peptidoglycan/xylan/chitin deacetylase (PgdA/CDA1 family)